MVVNSWQRHSRFLGRAFLRSWFGQCVLNAYIRLSWMNLGTICSQHFTTSAEISSLHLDSVRLSMMNGAIKAKEEGRKN